MSDTEPQENAIEVSESPEENVVNPAEEDDTTTATSVVASDEPLSEEPVSEDPVTPQELTADTKDAIDELEAELPDEIDSHKILVQDLEGSTAEDTLKEYFSKFGEVRVAKLKKDSEGKSKGFAFVIFSDTANITKALEQEEHKIDDKAVRLTKAMPSSDKMKTNKLFVGGLPAALSEDQLRAYFEKYGLIQNFQFIVNKMTNTRKAFCFIVFDDPDAVEKITEGKIPPNSVVHTIEGHTVDCKKKFDEDHPVQRKIKARSAQYNQNRQNNYHNSSSSYGQGHYDPAAYAASYGAAYPGYTGYEQYYGAYGAYGYPGYSYPYPGYSYPAYPYPPTYGASAYGPAKTNRSGVNYNYKPY